MADMPGQLVTNLEIQGWVDNAPVSQNIKNAVLMGLTPLFLEGNPVDFSEVLTSVRKGKQRFRETSGHFEKVRGQGQELESQFDILIAYLVDQVNARDN